MNNKLLSPKSDIVFKYIFGDVRNTDILTDFLQSILDLPKDEYDHIEILNPYLPQETPDDKLGILDVKLHTTTKNVIEIEIQLLEIMQMRERIIFYISKMITEQIAPGENYGVIKKAISIVITNHVLVKENQSYFNKYRLYDKKTGSEFTDKIEVNTLELPKLPFETDNSKLWNWLRFLKSDKEEELKMLAEKSKPLEKAVNVLTEISQDKIMRQLAESREKGFPGRTF